MIVLIPDHWLSIYFWYYLIVWNSVYLLVPQKNLNFDFLNISGRNALLCKCFSGLMQSFCYLQGHLAPIHSMTRLQAILTSFKDFAAYAL